MKKVILISILLGMVFTIGVAYFTANEVSIPTAVSTTAGITPDLCAGEPFNEYMVQQKIGAPVVYKKTTVRKDYYCRVDTQGASGEKTMGKNYVMSWQFYVNWAIWTLPFLGIGYVINSRSNRLPPKAPETTES